LQERLRRREVALSSGQIAIARYAMANPMDMAVEPAAVVAARAGVSASSVIRFSRVLGFSGYPELQRMFQRYVISLQHHGG
jgi:DNA-binding MurR/RpiR family transcriptional regulator